MYVPPLTWLALVVGTVWIYLVCRLADRPRTPEQKLELSRRKTQGPYGVAGWLLILVAILLLFDPVLLFIRTSHDFVITEQQYPDLPAQSKWHSFKLATWSLYTVAAVLTVFAGIELMFRRQWAAVRHAVAILWIVGPIFYVVDEIGVPFFVYGETDVSSSELLGGMLTPIFIVSAWTAYLLTSKRVRTTYQRLTTVWVAAADA